MDQSIIAPIIIFLTFLVTYRGEKEYGFKEEYLFWTDGILIRKEYYRMFTKGLLHSGWWHFGFNMFALFVFSYSLEVTFGYVNYILVYIAALFGSSLLTLYFHRNHGDYRSLGASGAVSGIIMASVVLFPQGEIGFILIPVGIKSWIFGAAYILISIFGIKNQVGNIGHEAHLGGAIVGILAACVLEPQSALNNWWVVLLLLVPCAVFLFLAVRNPAILFIEGYWGEEVADLRENVRTRKRKSQPTLDDLLDKIRENGYDSLSNQDKKLLDEYQRKL